MVSLCDAQRPILWKVPETSTNCCRAALFGWRDNLSAQEQHSLCWGDHVGVPIPCFSVTLVQGSSWRVFLPGSLKIRCLWSLKIYVSLEGKSESSDPLLQWLIGRTQSSTGSDLRSHWETVPVSHSPLSFFFSTHHPFTPSSLCNKSLFFNSYLGKLSPT